MTRDFLESQEKIHIMQVKYSIPALNMKIRLVLDYYRLVLVQGRCLN